MDDDDVLPCSYVYVAQVQAAAKALEQALDAMSDQRLDGREALRQVTVARQRLDNVFALRESGIVS